MTILSWILGNKRLTAVIALAAVAAFFLAQSKWRGMMLDTARAAYTAAMGAIAARDGSHGDIVAAFETKEAQDEDRRKFREGALGAVHRAETGGAGLDPALRAAYERVYLRWAQKTGSAGIRHAAKPADVPRAGAVRAP